MKQKPATLVFFLLLEGFVFCQPIIKGRVVIAGSETAVPGSSVFINNTSKGTATDKDGYFELKDIPPGKHELIVSSIGYETNVFSFNTDQLPLRLRVELDVKVKELENVVVEPSEEGSWERWGKIFMDNFIGNTPNALHCKIKNERAIKFRYYKKSNRVVAFADEPIIIENRALGFRISYKLEEFEVNFKTRVSVFFGYPFFEEIQSGRKGMISRWRQNRDKAFYGSIMHFMRSLYEDSLSQHGFEARRATRIVNAEKERVKNIYRAARSVTSPTSAGVPTASNQAIDLRKLPPDSLAYYERVLRQEDYKEIVGTGLLNADSLFTRTEGTYRILFFTDYLYITYKNELEEEDYLRVQGERRKPGYQRSWLTLAEPGPVEVDVNGNYPPQNIIALGYWGWSEKMADFLPLDYTP